MYKHDLASNNLQWLICHKTKPNQTKPSNTALPLKSLPTPVLNQRGQDFNISSETLYNQNGYH